MTKRPTSSHAREAQREDFMSNAGVEVTRLLEQADIRNIGPEMVAVIISQILAARNATLAGKVLYALEVAIQKYPIVKIIGAGTLKVDGTGDQVMPNTAAVAEIIATDDTDVVDLVELPDGSYGTPH